NAVLAVRRRAAGPGLPGAPLRWSRRRGRGRALAACGRHAPPRGRVELDGPFDNEAEPVTRIEQCGGLDVGPGRRFSVGPREIEIVRRPRLRPEAEIERHPTLEHPTPLGNFGETREQTLEDDAFAKALDRQAGFTRLPSEPIFEGGTK